MVTNGQPGVLLADQAFDCIRELLRTDGLRAGQFVSIANLVALTGFPLAPTREAVQKAGALGLVSIVPKRGVLILEADNEIARQCLDVRCIFDQEGARRLAADPNIGQLTALIASHEDIIREATKNDVSPSLQRKAMEVDWHMHAALAEGIANPLAHSIYTLNRDKLTIMYNTRPLLPDRLVPAFNEHIAILQAIINRDAETAVAEIKLHYRQIHRWWGILDD